MLAAMGRDVGTDDDTALLAVRLTADAPVWRLELTLPPRAESARAARHAVRDLVDSHVAELLVTELVANAVRHAGPGEVVVRAATGDSACGSRSSTAPRRCPSRPVARPRGRSPVAGCSWSSCCRSGGGRTGCTRASGSGSSWSCPTPTSRRQNPLASSRPPVTVLPASDGVGTAAARIAALICARGRAGCDDAYSAAAPVTCGVAIDVPL